MMNPAEFANIARAEHDFWWYRGMERILLRMLDPLLRHRVIDRVLEAGCGTGHFARLLQRRGQARIYPTDLQMEGLRYGVEHGLERVCQADVVALPFPSRRFDLALSLDVIVHFPRGRERDAIKELARVLAPGGILTLRVAALDLLRSRHSQFTHERQRFTRSRLIRLVREHGIRILRCTYANTLLLPLALLKFCLWEPLTRQRPASGVGPVPAWLNRLLYRFLMLESLWLRKGLNLPIGQSLILIGEKIA